MSRLDDIQRELDARMAAIQKNIFGTSSGPVSAPAPKAAWTARDAAIVPPILKAADLSSVSNINFRVGGFAPGSAVENLPANFPAEIRDLMLLVAEAAKRESMPIGSATLIVTENGKFIGMQQLPYQETRVFQQGIPPDAASPERDIALKVARGAAYFGSRVGLSRFDEIRTLWALIDVRLDLGVKDITISYAANAFSSPQKRGGRKALLCFSPAVTDQIIVSHEMTHSVSDDVVGWGNYYESETGAMNESCSDIFGKFAEFAWNGRDMSDPKRWRVSSFRDMAHPSSMEGRSWKAPDYYLEPPDEGNPRSGWLVAEKPSMGNDRGGVHINSGVLTRLCFLLCEGESFTRKDGVGFVVPAIGFDKAETLFANAFLSGGYLPERPSVYDVYGALVQAASDLSFTDGELQALQTACSAVNIIPPANQANQRSQSMICEKRSLRGLGDDPATALPRAYAEELGLTVPGSGYVCDDCGQATGSRGVERSLKYRQTFDEMPVFGASAVARVDGSATVVYLNSGFSRRLGEVRSAGSVDASAASDIAREESGGLQTLACERVVFDPSLFGRSGEPTVAWHVTSGLADNPESHRLIDSVTGQVLFEAPLQIS